MNKGNDFPLHPTIGDEFYWVAKGKLYVWTGTVWEFCCSEDNKTIKNLCDKIIELQKYDARKIKDFPPPMDGTPILIYCGWMPATDDHDA